MSSAIFILVAYFCPSDNTTDIDYEQIDSNWEIVRDIAYLEQLPTYIVPNKEDGCLVTKVTPIDQS